MIEAHPALDCYSARLLVADQRLNLLIYLDSWGYSLTPNNTRCDTVSRRESRTACLSVSVDSKTVHPSSERSAPDARANPSTRAMQYQDTVHEWRSLEVQLN